MSVCVCAHEREREREKEKKKMEKEKKKKRIYSDVANLYFFSALNKFSFSKVSRPVLF